MLYLTIYYLTAGFTLGSLLLIHKAVPLHPLLWSFLPIHVEYLLWGWTTQLALAVGYAIFPRFRSDPVRGNPSVYWAMLVLFNLGIIISGFNDYSFASPWLSFSGQLAKTIGVGGFAINLWQRIRPYQV